MKQARQENLVVVIGRNRRVYARVYKMIRYKDGMVEHYLQSERTKAGREGFMPTGVVLFRPNETTWLYRVQYEKIG